MNSKVLLVLPAAVVGVVATYSECMPVRVCVDGVNDCGVRWGGCYDRCDPAASPTPPPCETSPPTTSDDPDDCSTRTVCWDGFNDCGMMYGGCFPDCQPWPTFEPPPCPPSSTWETVTRTPTGHPECEEEGEHIICVDKVNECGMKYGGCYDYCATPTPEFEVPTCPSGTGTEEPQPTGTGDGGLSIDEKREEEGSFIIRADGIEDCGNGWGACYDACSTTPCSPTATPTELELGGSDCAETTICVDYVNDCGMMYGG
ncbi:hypothetical protein VUR80DRAFT_825 [Thermomyces stellatus]